MAKKQESPVQIVWREEEKTLTLEGEPVLEMALRWPQVEGGGRGLRRVNCYYARLAGAWQNRWETTGYRTACGELTACRAASRPFHPWRVRLEGQAELLPGDLYSVRLDSREQRCDGKPLYTCSCALWRGAEGVPVSLSGALGGRVKRRTLLALAEKAVRAKQARGELFPDEDVSQKLRRFFHPERFHRTGEGIALYYPQAVLAPAVEGVVTLPLTGLLTPAQEADGEKQAKKQA